VDSATRRRLTLVKVESHDPSFPDEAGRNAHLAGKVAAALMAQAPDLLQHSPSISKVEVLAVKLPSSK